MASSQPQSLKVTEEYTLANDLLDWLMQEMKFGSSPYISCSSYLLPSKEDLKLLCQGPMVDVWKYIIKHVKSVKTVKHVRKNLSVHRHRLSRTQQKQPTSQASSSDDNVEKLQQELHKLSAELSASESDVQLLEKELQHSSAEIAELETQYQSVVQRVRDLQKKESVLTVASRCAGETTDKYKEYTKRIAQRTRDVTFRGVDHHDEERYVDTEEGHSSKSLESESCRDVRIACEGISEMLHEILNGRFTSDQSALEKAQQELWKKVQKTASSRRIGETVKSLVTNTQAASAHLRDETVGLDIAKDANELSFSYKTSGKLEDVSSPPQVQQSVHQLLLASNQEHVLRFFKEQEHKNESWKLEARLDDIMAQIHKHIHKALGEHPHNVPLAKSYVDALISAAEERCVVPCLRTEMDGLVERIFQAKREKEELHAKHARIQDFKRLVEKKQNLITVLATHNTNTPERLGEQREKILSYMSSHAMSGHVTTMDHFSSTLRDSLIHEVDKFSHLLLPTLLSVQMDSATKVGLSDLSLAAMLHPTLKDKMKISKKICTALEFPEYKSLDRLAVEVLRLHHQLQQLKLAQERRDEQVKTARHNTHPSTDDVQAIVGLCEEAKRHSDSQKQELLPRLEKCLTILGSLAAEVESAQNNIHVWTDQPAQFTTPWVRTEGMTFDQWLNRWRVAVTQVHKMMVQTPRK